MERNNSSGDQPVIWNESHLSRFRGPTFEPEGGLLDRGDRVWVFVKRLVPMPAYQMLWPWTKFRSVKCLAQVIPACRRIGQLFCVGVSCPQAGSVHMVEPSRYERAVLR